MRYVYPLLAVVLAGCAGTDPAPPGEEHPASADAAEAAWVPPPDRLAGPVEPLAEEKAPEGATWTCPMHPEVTSAAKGECPKCGMDLEPKAGHEHK